MKDDYLNVPTTTTYGHCPRCDAQGVTRERRPDGYTICKNRHKFLSAKWAEFNATRTEQPIKSRGWATRHGFIDFDHPVTLEEAERVMAANHTKIAAMLANITDNAP